MYAMNNSELTNHILRLVAKHALCQSDRLSITTKIGEDLRIVGDDADELLAEFSSEFNVDMYNIDFETYFPCEATANMHFYLSAIAKSKYQNPLVLAIRYLEAKFWRLFASKTSYQKLTIEDLVKIASRGRV
ncbi:hypothetical protein MnBA_37500 [Marinobacterium sp. BA1]